MQKSKKRELLHRMEANKKPDQAANVSVVVSSDDNSIEAEDRPVAGNVKVVTDDATDDVTVVVSTTAKPDTEDTPTPAPPPPMPMPAPVPIAEQPQLQEPKAPSPKQVAPKSPSPQQQQLKRRREGEESSSPRLKNPQYWESNVWEDVPKRAASSKPRPSPLMSPKKKLQPPQQRAGSVKKAPPSIDNIEELLSSNPEFATAFSRTIPISPSASPVMEDDQSPSAPPEPAAPEQVEAEEPTLPDEEPPMVEDEEEESSRMELDGEGEEEEDQKQTKKPSSSRGFGSAASAKRKKGEPSAPPVPMDDFEDPYGTMDSAEAALEHEKETFGEQQQHSSLKQAEDEEEEQKKADDTGKDKKKQQQSKAKEGEDEEEESDDNLTDDQVIYKKFRLIESIKLDSTKVPPVKPPVDSMTLQELKQIRRLQLDQKADSAAVRILGSGLIGIVGFLEMMNETVNPVGRLLGNDKRLRLGGAKEVISENIELYNDPFYRIVEKQRQKKGKVMEVPPWLEIVMLTGGILGQVHKANLEAELEMRAKAEMQDKEAGMEAARVQELIRRRAMEQRQRAASLAQYPVDDKGEPTPYKDTQLKPHISEEEMIKEFADCENMPSLSPDGVPLQASDLDKQQQQKKPATEVAASPSDKKAPTVKSLDVPTPPQPQQQETYSLSHSAESQQQKPAQEQKVAEASYQLKHAAEDEAAADEDEVEEGEGEDEEEEEEDESAVEQPPARPVGSVMTITIPNVERKKSK